MARAGAADFDPDNASILVCGGGGVALHVTRKLKDMGSWCVVKFYCLCIAYRIPYCFCIAAEV